MTYLIEKSTLGKKPFTIIEVDLPSCSLTYGTSPCTASGAIGTECKNTRSTCQDVPNFTKTIKTYTWCSQISEFPIALNAIPCISGSPKFTPTEILPDKGASVRGSVEFTLKDFTYHDRGVDKYALTRPYDLSTQGTYLGRLISNNPYYVKSMVRVKTGYISSSGYNAADFETKLYMLYEIKDVKQKGNDYYYTFVAKDLLSLADNARVKLPVPSDGKLNASITATATTSFILDSTTTLADYPVGGTRVRIGSEVLSYASRSGATCSTLVRELEGTTASSHAASDSVQIGINLTGSPAAVLDELLETYSGIDGDTYIPYDAGLTTPTGTNDLWDDEEDNWLPGVTLDTWFYKSVGIMALINDLCLSLQIDLWFDEVAQKIQFKVNAPPLGNSAVTVLTDISELLDKSTAIKHITKKRVSRVVFYYNKIDVTKGNEETNFSKHHFERDADAEDVDTFNEVRTMSMTSSWLKASNSTSAVQTAQRVIARFGTTPKLIKFRLDAKDSALWTGDLCDIDSRALQDGDGTNKVTRFQITKVKEIIQGTEYEYTGLESKFNSKRNAFFADNASPQYGSATTAQKLDRAYFAPNSGTFSDGGDPYLFI